MFRIARKLALPALIALSLGCGPEPPAAEPETPRDTGAGSVLKLDDALDAIVPADYTIEKLAGGFIFTEGPIWVREGGPYLLFSDVRGNAIHKWTPGGGISEYKKPVFEGEYEEGRSVSSNGLTLDSDGRLIVCEHGNRRVSRVGADGAWSTIAERYEGKRLNSPNDAVFHSSGWLYFTDPPYGLVGQDEDPAKELDFNGIFRLSPDGETLELLNKDLTRPNGIAFSPDEKTLYVANSDPNRKVWMAYEVNENGSLGAPRVFADVTAETAEGLPDGLKLDTAGNLYATGPGGVWIFSPEGKHLGTIKPEEVPANCAWGDDGKTLYMTARTGLYRIRLNAEGPMP